MRFPWSRSAEPEPPAPPSTEAQGNPPPADPPAPEVEYRSADYTEQRIEEMDRRVNDGGNVGDVRKTAAAAFAALLYGRAMATAIVEPEDMAQVVTPSVLAMIGRRLVLRGNSVYTIEVSGGDIRLQPASEFEIFGPPNPNRWRYRCHLPGPTSPDIRTVAAAGVVHCRINEDGLQPWLGVSPLESAGLTSDMLAALETRLGQESTARTGYLLPTPRMGEESEARLRADLRTMRGQTGLVETTADNYQQGGQAPRGDWEARRIGAQIPATNAQLRGSVAHEVLAAAGVPPALWVGSDGGSMREAYRQLLTNHIQPLGLIIAQELSEKLEADISFRWSRLAAADIAARARALGSLVQAGVAPEEATELAGLAE